MATGFSYPFTIVSSVGIGDASDAYFLTLSITTFFLSVLSAPITNVATASLANAEDYKSWRQRAWANHISVACTYMLIAGLLLVFGGIGLELLLPTYRAPDLHRTLLVWQIGSMGFLGLQASAFAAVQSRRCFLYAESSQFLISIALLPLLWVTMKSHGIVGAAWVQLLRAALQWISLLPFSGKPVIVGSGADVRAFFRQIRWPWLGGAYYKTDTLIERALLVRADGGILSAYHLAQQVLSTLASVYARAVISPLVVSISAKIAQEGINSGVTANLRWHAIFATGCCVCTAVVGTIAAATLSESVVTKAALIFLCLMGTLLGGLLGQLANGVLYAMGETRIQFRIGSIGYTAFLPIKLASWHFAGVYGLALSSSLYYLCNASYLWIGSRRIGTKSK